jgi:hypothetical protein
MRKFELKQQCGASISTKNRCSWRRSREAITIRTLTMANGKYDRFVVMRLPMAGSEVTPPLVIDSG